MKYVIALIITITPSALVVGFLYLFTAAPDYVVGALISVLIGVMVYVLLQAGVDLSREYLSWLRENKKD